MPISHIPHWLYVILFVTIGIAEVPLNAKIFEIFGENQLSTWIYSGALGLALPWFGHFVGMKSREHGEGVSWKNVFLAAAGCALVVAALYKLAIMRQSYLNAFKEDLGLTDNIVDTSFDFFFVNLIVFGAAALISYYAHDPVHGYPNLYNDYRKAQRDYQRVERESREQLKAAQDRRAHDVETAHRKLATALADVTKLKGEHDRVLRRAQEQEARWLDQLGRDLAVYRQENLNHRPDQARPKAFDRSYDFRLVLQGRQEIQSHEGS